MKAYVGVTDREWYGFLRSRPGLDEVNFWRPLGGTPFRALSPGQPFLFKLPYPENAIVGGGFFATFSVLPASLTWEAFGAKNGAPSEPLMRERIERIRQRHGLEVGSKEDYEIGCIVLVEPFFFEPHQRVPAPADWKPNIVSGRGYDLNSSEGQLLWSAVLHARASARHLGHEPAAPMYGEPTPVRLRLGQGAFRVLITDAYDRNCAVTGEKTLPVLQAAHIRPVAQGGLHRVGNGLLMRSDIHTLFDLGYVTISPQHTFRVSQRLKKDWHNGRIYYELDGRRVRLPLDRHRYPDPSELEWHSDVVFKT
jgi:putative restriction endonuclease